MAANTRQANSISWEEIPAIDKIGKGYTPLTDLNPAHLRIMDSLAYWSNGVDITILVWQEQGTKTWIQGRSDAVGLTELCRQREIEALRGQRVVQVEVSGAGTVYILVEDGTLYSAGDPSDGQLGRPDNRVPSNHFGAVAIPQPVKRIAARCNHVLAMTEDRVFAFGINGHDQLGTPDGETSKEPRELYAGAGLAAPKQVACGQYHSVILTAGGQVHTCGSYGFSGQGRSAGNHEMGEVRGLRGHPVQQVHTCGSYGFSGQGRSAGNHEMGEVRGLRGHPVQQVGSTLSCTYALSGGVLYGWGENTYGQMGVGHKSEEQWIWEPTVIDCGGRQITSFRCEFGLIVALTDTGDGLYWGWRRDRAIIQSPELVTGRLHPREVFAEGYNSGGLVFPDTEENRHRLFRIDVRTLRDIVVALQCDFAAAVEARETAETRLQKSEDEITKLKESHEETIKTAVEAGETAESRLQKSEDEINKLKVSLEETIKAAVEAGEIAETRLQKSEAKITKLQCLLEKNIQTASEAGRGRVSQAEEINELRRKIFGLQMTQDASAQQDLERENVFSGTIRLLEQGRLEQAEELMELRRRIAGMQLAPDAATGHAMQQQHAQRDGQGECSARIAELERENSELRMGKREQLSQIAELERENSDLRMEKREQLSQIAELDRENSELRMEKREQLSQFRSATLDYRELLLQYNTLVESRGTTQLTGTRSVEQNRRGIEERREAANPSPGRQRRN